MVCCGLVLTGVLWFGVAWCDVLCCGVMWCGVVRCGVAGAGPGGEDASATFPDSGPPLPQEFITNLFFGWGYAVGGLVHAAAAKPIWDALRGSCVCFFCWGGGCMCGVFCLGGVVGRGCMCGVMQEDWWGWGG
jgi:hypothetical protein